MRSIRASLIAAFGVLALAFAGCAAQPVDDISNLDEDLRIDCSYVKCAMPLCAEGQHLVQNSGSCCPTCVGRPERTDRCATVLCAAYECPEGEQRVFRGPNDCCGSCQPENPVAECQTDLDCPQYACFACPCPVSECVGHQCVTTTPDESTCSSGI